VDSVLVNRELDVETDYRGFVVFDPDCTRSRLLFVGGDAAWYGSRGVLYFFENPEPKPRGLFNVPLPPGFIKACHNFCEEHRPKFPRRVIGNVTFILGNSRTLARDELRRALTILDLGDQLDWSERALHDAKERAIREGTFPTMGYRSTHRGVTKIIPVTSLYRLKDRRVVAEHGGLVVSRGQIVTLCGIPWEDAEDFSPELREPWAFTDRPYRRRLVERVQLLGASSLEKVIDHHAKNEDEAQDMRVDALKATALYDPLKIGKRSGKTAKLESFQADHAKKELQNWTRSLHDVLDGPIERLPGDYAETDSLETTTDLNPEKDFGHISEGDENQMMREVDPDDEPVAEVEPVEGDGEVGETSEQYWTRRTKFPDRTRRIYGIKVYSGATFCWHSKTFLKIADAAKFAEGLSERNEITFNGEMIRTNVYAIAALGGPPTEHLMLPEPPPPPEKLPKPQRSVTLQPVSADTPVIGPLKNRLNPRHDAIRSAVRGMFAAFGSEARSTILCQKHCRFPGDDPTDEG
jgi:hypothetical protein